MSIRQTIQNRRTLKVLADPATPWGVPEGDFEDQIETLLEVAAWAPFHYTSDASHHTEVSDSPAPWRFHGLSAKSCRRLLQRLGQLDEAPGKVANMLAAAQTLILATWLPDPPAAGSLGFQAYEPTIRNMEHVAAASAAVQNLLLLATDQGLHTYWSSGGVLRSETVYDWLGIPRSQVLLGAVFLFPADIGEVATKPGANRGRQGNASRWMRWIAID